MSDLTKNFSKAEMTCRCGCGGIPKSEFMDRLQELRDFVDFPLKITSGYRCPKHNAAEGGVKASKHMQGMAADIWIKDMSPSQRFKLVGGALMNFQGVGIGESILHVDLRDVATLWVYQDR